MDEEFAYRVIVVGHRWSDLAEADWERTSNLAKSKSDRCVHDPQSAADSGASVEETRTDVGAEDW